MKNTMTDVHNILMEELERLSDHTLVGDELKEEMARSKAMTSITQTIINNSNTALSAARFVDEQLSDKPLVPAFLIESDNKRLGA